MTIAVKAQNISILLLSCFIIFSFGCNRKQDRQPQELATPGNKRNAQSAVITLKPEVTQVSLSAAESPYARIRSHPYPYAPTPVTLHGVLRQVQHFGPPGFGETPQRDARVTVLVLVLDPPIRTKPAPHADPKHTTNLNAMDHIDQVQLFWDHSTGTSETQAKLLIGKRLVVTGTLDEATAPMEFTKVTMSVSSCKPE